MNTGERIRVARKAAGLTQKQLGDQLGVSGSMIGQYENQARKPSPETIIKIADALSISSLELVFDSGDLTLDKLELLKSQNDPNSVKMADLISQLWKHDSQKIAESVADTMSNFHQSFQGFGNAHLNKLKQYYFMLNSDGRQKALEFLELLTKVPEYQAPEDTESVQEPSHR